MQLCTATADARSKAHDRIAVNAGQALDAPDGQALGEGGDNFNLLVAGEVVHGGPNPTRWGNGLGGEDGLKSAIFAERSISLGPNPGVE